MTIAIGPHTKNNETNTIKIAAQCEKGNNTYVTRVAAPTQEKSSTNAKKNEKNYTKRAQPRRKKHEKTTTNAREATQKKQHEKNIRKNRAQAFFIFFPSNPKKCLYLPSQQLLFRNLKMASDLEKPKLSFMRELVQSPPKN